MSMHNEQNRPLIVKSQNLKHSTNMLFPDDPPTDWQIIKLKKIGYHGLIPCCRAKADYEIRKIEGNLEQEENPEKFEHTEKCKKTEVKT